MLDSETKRRIDSARQILVGKVPDPKGQVEQITTALIYKFMDDMDKEAQELGGEEKFFTGEYEKYAWSRLMDVRLGGQERLNLYTEALAHLWQNKNLPALFQQIFKSSFLPFRDPETLNLFLKEINGFVYDHSERLGDSYEYLLNVLGTQGDAGQFRTPRHIIDFIVEAVNPTKDDTVLDPACGTAGFLISAFKHILKQNTNKKSGDALTPDEKRALMNRFTGYDISPDMVRLSLVNMYLHGFPLPNIVEFDTLGQEERWDDSFNVILANPPFMTPKGGVMPHKRFSVQASRSEVLFVDYIADHLTPNGRAGVIVPEGIIFQSGNAYKKLRKMLVEGYLYAVVSLPAGAFNPYSGVKTSVLLMDKNIAKRNSEILFVKVENDGFDLGAQRRAIAKNDLPQALEILKAWKEGKRPENPLAVYVEKARIAESGDFNLSGDRYRIATDFSNAKWPMIAIGELCEINPKKSEIKEISPSTEVSFVPMSDISETGMYFDIKQTKKISEVSSGYTYFRDNDVLLAKVTPCFENGKSGLATRLNNKIGFGSSEFIVLRAQERVLPELIYYFVTSEQFREAGKIQMTGTGGLQRIPISFVSNFLVPLPPLEVQQQMVEELDGYQKIIDGARTVLDHYRPRIAINPDWPMEPLGALFQTKSGTTPLRSRTDYFKEGTIPWVKTLDLTDGPIKSTDEKITQQALDDTHLSILPVGTVLVAMYGGFNQIGRSGVLEIEATSNQAMTALLPTPRVSPYFLNAILVASKDYWKTVANSTRKDPNITKTDVLHFKFPLPPLVTQQAIVAEIEAEQALVEGNKKLIDVFERKIKERIGRVWGDDIHTGDL